MPSLITVSNVSKKYTTDEGIVTALDDISLEIDSGDFVAIVGASGSGKSTLMNVLGCLDVPNTGTYLLDSDDTCLLSDDQLSEIRNRKIGFIFQGFNLIDSMTAVENIELPLLYRGVSHKIRSQLADAALEQVGLTKRRGHLPSQMSGGQQQRVAIARAIAARPPILLADEPTGNLDQRSGSDIMNILLDLNSEGKTIVLITHDMTIARMANRVIRIEDGHIL